MKVQKNCTDAIGSELPGHSVFRKHAKPTPRTIATYEIEPKEQELKEELTYICYLISNANYCGSYLFSKQ